jgi:uncharacterized membrane protein SpoIIM required for sporulation
MLQKPWFKIFIWFVTTFFFFLAAGVIISVFKPGPSESEVMQFMMGMMSAMDKSMMGVAMNLENDSTLRSAVTLANTMALPVIMISIIAGFVIRHRQRGDKDV